MPDVWQVFLIGALAFAGIAPMPGRAADLPRPTPIDAKVDILGLRIGQTPAEVRATLAGSDPEGRFQEGKAKIEGSTEEYVNQVAFRTTKTNPADPNQADVADEVQVLFSAPASGNRSLAIERSVYYFNNSMPIVSKTVDLLEAKYGVSPELKTRNFTPYNSYEKFVFDESGKVRLQSNLYNIGNCGLGANENLGNFSSACRSAILSWDIEPASDHDRVEKLFLLLKDHDFALAALKVDNEAAKKAHDAELARLRTGVASPRL